MLCVFRETRFQLLGFCFPAIQTLPLKWFIQGEQKTLWALDTAGPVSMGIKYTVLKFTIGSASQVTNTSQESTNSIIILESQDF